MTARGGLGWRAGYGDVVAVGFLLAVALAWCAPAFVHGHVFGSYDLALNAGLGHTLVTNVHDLVNGDQARQDAAWAHLNWTAVHHGWLPLWNPYSDLGLPELANFQSAPASLPSLISYLVPISSAYTVAVVAKLVIGGVGCYFAGRVLGAGRCAALLAGVVGEVGGPMAAWAGWPQTGVAEWTGFVVALVVLALRAPSWRVGAGFAIVVAFACAGGFPEVLALLAIAAGVLAISILAGDAWQRRRSPLSATGYGAGLLTLLGGGLGGVLLSAPIWLPSIPVLRASVTALRPHESVLAPSTLELLFDPSYFGSPSTSATWFGAGSAGTYFEAACFVGPAVICCALLALVRCRRSSVIVGCGLALAVEGCLAFGLTPIYTLAVHLPEVSTIAFGRALLIGCDLLGILAAVGVSEIAKARPDRVTWGGYVGVTALTAALAFAGANGAHLNSTDHRERLDGFLLGAIPLLVLGAYLAHQSWVARVQVAPPVTKSLSLGRRVGAALGPRIGPVALVLAVATTLVLSSSTVSTWSRSYLPENAALAGYLSTTAGGLVALGGNHAPYQPPRLGIYPELNAAYEVRELAGYDAVTPQALEKLWVRLAPAPDLAQYELDGDVTQFAPAVTTVAQARALGVAYLLEPLHGAARLVESPSPCVTTALQTAGITSAGTVTGILDDLEWLVEKPALLRSFPVRRLSSLGMYLNAEAVASPAIAQDPAPSGAAAAKGVVASSAQHPELVHDLASCLTLRPGRGLVEVATLGTEALYRVPGASGAYFANSDGIVNSSLDYRADASAAVTVTVRRAAWLTVAIDDEPGWSATTDGRGLQTRRVGDLLEVRVPDGRHRIVVTYWPKYLTLGLALGAMTLAAGVAGGMVPVLRRRRRSRVDRLELRPTDGATDDAQ